MIKNNRIVIYPNVRTIDAHGQGHFGAPRGNRVHMGVDYAVLPGTRVGARCPGRVSKIGRCYADTAEYTYIQITTKEGYNERYFYVEPYFIGVGDDVVEGELLGHVQDLDDRYPGITPHIHFEVKDGTVFLKPEEYLEGRYVRVPS